MVNFNELISRLDTIEKHFGLTGALAGVTRSFVPLYSGYIKGLQNDAIARYSKPKTKLQRAYRRVTDSTASGLGYLPALLSKNPLLKTSSVALTLGTRLVTHGITGHKYQELVRLITKIIALKRNVPIKATNIDYIKIHRQVDHDLLNDVRDGILSEVDIDDVIEKFNSRK